MKRLVFSGLFFAIFLLIVITGGFVLSWRLLFIFCLMTTFGFFWIRVNTAKLGWRTGKIQEFYYVGDTWEEEIVITNFSPFPRYMIKIIHHVPAGLLVDTGVHYFDLPGKGSYRWNSRVTASKRGIYHTGLFCVDISNPFGFARTLRKVSQPQRIIVYPKLAELPYFEPFQEQQVSARYGAWPLISETGSSAVRVREYTSSERRARIHWPATAHSGKLMVKEFDVERLSHFSRYVWIIPDMQKEVQVYSGKESTEEYIISTAASLVKKYQELNKQIGLIASGDQTYLFEPDSDIEIISEIMKSLAVMKAEGHIPLARLLLQSLDYFQNYSQIAVISPSTDKDLVSALLFLRNRRFNVLAIVVDPASFGKVHETDDTITRLTISGIQTYVVKRNVDIGRSLDTRLIRAGLNYFGVRL